MERPVVAGAAGGVGTTTLAAALRAWDGGTYRGGLAVHVLVCRSTMSSLLAAQHALAAFPPGLPPVLAVVGDGQPLVSAMRASLRMTEPHVLDVVHVPHVAGWRALANPWQAAGQILAVEPPRDLRRFARAVALLVDAISPPALQPAGHRPPTAGGPTRSWPTAL